MRTCIGLVPSHFETEKEALIATNTAAMYALADYRETIPRA
jgi:hypothetical protein